MTENKVKVNCRVSRQVKEYIDEECKYYGLSIGSYISMLIVEKKEKSMRERNENIINELQSSNDLLLKVLNRSFD